MNPSKLIMWAVQEIRELDELCRSQIPGYDPLHSEDMAKLVLLQSLASTLLVEQDKQPPRKGG